MLKNERAVNSFSRRTLIFCHSPHCALSLKAMSARLERSAGAWRRNAPMVQVAAISPDARLAVLELFSGTGSFTSAVLRAVPTARSVTLDMRPSQRPTHVANILEWDYRAHITPGEFSVVWASPPCTEYSCAKTVGERDLITADACVQRAFEIIDYAKPHVWFMENPATGLLPKRMHLLRSGIVPALVDYCPYGFVYRKRTCIWSNLPGLQADLKLCPGHSCHAVESGRHRGSVGGGGRERMRFSLTEKHTMPPELMDLLVQRALSQVVLTHAVESPGETGASTADA